MPLVTQAEFARMHVVSRKAVTTWKKRGYLVFDGSNVDVEQSNARLKAAGRAWEGVTGAPKSVTRTAESVTPVTRKRISQVTAADRVTACPVVDLDGTGEANRSGQAIGVDDAVTNLSIVVDVGAADFVRFALRHLPSEVVLPMAAEFLTTQRQGAVEIADEVFGPPPGLASWALHPLFRGAVMVEHEWQEALHDAAAWKAANA